MNGAAGTANDSLIGTALDDTANGLAGNDVLSTGDGDDTLNGGAGLDRAYGGDGNDTFRFNTGDAPAGERIHGGLGDDSLKLLTSTNFTAALLYSVESADLAGRTGTFLGSQFGGSGITSVTSSVAGGALVVTGSANLSAIAVQSGITVTLNGAAGVVNDTITGSQLANTINGLDGNDFLTGLGGNDIITGAGGLDVIVGGLGKDTMTGGLAADRFDFNAISEMAKGAAVRDVITDFSHAQADRIDLSTIDASTKVAGSQAFAFLGAAAFSGVAGQLRYAGGIVSGDINGDKVADFEIGLTGAPALVAADFIL